VLPPPEQDEGRRTPPHSDSEVQRDRRERRVAGTAITPNTATTANIDTADERPVMDDRTAATPANASTPSMTPMIRSFDIHASPNAGSPSVAPRAPYVKQANRETRDLVRPLVRLAAALA
jgi:hypothetical protein